MAVLFKRILCLIMCTVMCISLCSCDAVSSLLQTKTVGMVEDTSLGYTYVGDNSLKYSDNYKSVSCRESYNCLDDDSKVLYQKLLEYVYYVYPQKNAEQEYKTKQVILPQILLDESRIRLTIKALTDDNPQIFWVSTTFGFMINTAENYTAVQLYSKHSPTVLKDKMSKLNTAVSSFCSTLRAGMSMYELELVIHDYILATCTYDKTIKVDDKGLPQVDTNAFDAYGALVNRKAVCEGYSRAFQLLCNGVGIKCINLIGESQGELHMWNAVELEDYYYYVDVTWDDSDEKAHKYDYFNINGQQLLYDHSFSMLVKDMTKEQICGDGTLNALTSNFFVPQYTGTKYNYYVYNCEKLTSFGASNITDGLLKAAQSKEEYFHFYIDPQVYTYDYAVDQLFFSYPQYFFSYTDAVNHQLADYSIDVQDMSIFQKKQLSVVTVILEYI